MFLDLPDAVFRGYEGDEQLLGAVRPDDDAPIAILRREIARLEPQTLYVPLAVGNHVDHQLCRDVGVSLLAEPRTWVMPGPDWAGTVAFYEDFPYAWWNNFQSLDELPEGALDGHPGGHAPDAALRGHRRPAGAQGPRHRDVREPDGSAVRRREGDGRGRSAAREGGRHDRPRQRPRRALLAQLPPVARQVAGLGRRIQTEPSLLKKRPMPRRAAWQGRRQASCSSAETTITSAP